MRFRTSNLGKAVQTSLLVQTTPKLSLENSARMGKIAKPNMRDEADHGGSAQIVPAIKLAEPGKATTEANNEA
ncbi:hypothetical protein BPNPMPFG_005604 [Mesorhizobium sp. AR07]|uniref:hypothetical protein n=1 Tax=Mesorhizobium sp. AR07 TaxID=2865838 RepID=UPI00215E68C1|nr:hypothetical protein [Mesorhizobium sp. AR07]UVK43770.1 hypothetical protein BPNPMPFG_005604 [Mesorhizobium sp. AR07]